MNLIVSSVLEALPADVTPPLEQATLMRWVLEYKISNQHGSTKPKARLVVLD